MFLRFQLFASNASRDVSGLMDFVEWNEYYESWYKGTPDNLRSNVEQIHEAFPGKPIVISEYGYCACTPERPEGDARASKFCANTTASFARGSMSAD